MILGFVAYVKDDSYDATSAASAEAAVVDTQLTARILLLANSERALEGGYNDEHPEHLGARAIARSHGYDADELPFTSFGVHDDQLTPEEFFAFISVEVSANSDYMPEARRRPKPRILQADDVLDLDKEFGTTREQISVEEAEENGKHDGPEASSRETKSADVEGVQYRRAPPAKIDNEALFNVVHRIDELGQLDARAGDKFKRVKTFMEQHDKSYDELKARDLNLGANRTPSHALRNLANPQLDNKILQRQMDLVKERRELDEIDDSDVKNMDPMTYMPTSEEGVDPDEALYLPMEPEKSISPKQYARELMAKFLPAPCGDGRHRIPKDQYEATLIAIEPLQLLWEFAATNGRLHDFNNISSFLQLLLDAPEGMCRQAFFHGPGGSGKTFFMTKVVLPVYRRYAPQCIREAASQNSAARLIRGCTFHFLAVLGRSQSYHERKPTDKLMLRLKMLWNHLVLFYADEASLVDPQLLAVMNNAANWGRSSSRRNLHPSEFADSIFGHMLMTVLAGDFMQLNPVMSHSLLEAFLPDTDLVVPRVPMYEKNSPEEREQKKKLDAKGLRIFDKIAQTVVLFRGSHRFKLNDPLVKLLEIMRTPGGAAVPAELKEQVEARLVFEHHDDHRLSSDYAHIDSSGKQIGPIGFFAQGFHSAINWDQVARYQHLWAVRAAALSGGPAALCNTRSGKPQLLVWSFPPAALRGGRRPNSKSLLDFISLLSSEKRVAALLVSFQKQRGQLIYYIQAVDSVHQAAYRNFKSVYSQALQVANMTSSTKGLISVLPAFEGMRMKVTKKLLAPDIVQEAPGEVLRIGFHERETFGEGPNAPRGRSQPSPDNPCWQMGYVLLDYLPRFLEVRLDGCAEDYTGTSRRGVWRLEPTTDDWTLKYKLKTTIDHPNARRTNKTAIVPLGITRSQVPAAPEPVGTYQAFQGKTCRNFAGEPVGHIIDLSIPSYFHRSETKQHLYMILGRATALEYTLLRNFPRTDDGELDWSYFEEGPPDYLVHFLEELERRDTNSKITIENIRKHFGIFPTWDRLPPCEKLKPEDEEFIYDASSWDQASQIRISRRVSQKRKVDDLGVYAAKLEPVHKIIRTATTTSAAVDAHSVALPPEKKHKGDADVAGSSTSRAIASIGVQSSALARAAVDAHSVALPPKKKQESDTAAASAAAHDRRYCFDLPEVRVATPLRMFARRHLHCDIVAREAGGGGDCLYHSIAAGIMQLLATSDDLATSMSKVLGMDFRMASKFERAQALRRLVAKELQAMEPEAFLNLMLTFVADERAGGWKDEWSPTAAFAESGFSCIRHADLVQAVSQNEDGRDGDLIMSFSQEGVDEPAAVPDGVNKLAALKMLVGDHFATMGNKHWGTPTDIAMLSNSLHIGFIIVASVCFGNDRWIAGLNLEAADFPHWICLYNKWVPSGHEGLMAPIHFQLAEYRPSNGLGSAASVFKIADLPPALVEHYNLCNDKRIGQRSSGGFS